MTSPEIQPPHPPPPASGAVNGRRDAGPGTGTGTALALLVAVVVAALACLVAVYAAPQSSRAAVAWGSGAAGAVLCAAVAMAAHARLTARDLRTALARREADTAEREAAAQHFATGTVPGLVEHLRNGASAETALAAAPPVGSDAHRRVLITLATEVHRGESLRASAMSACANAAGRVQALATSMAADLREMEHKHADEEVLGDLLHLDHRTAQAGRLADSIAVLTGARSGRRWAKPIVMESILRGAMGRISGYQRVRLHSTSTVAIAGHAAEGVMHALAELMDNAANFSPPTSEVHVYVEEVAAGVVITIEDGGLVMGEVALRRAQQAVSAESVDLTTLSGTRLGLAVVGRLARKHGLNVSFRPSAHGGTGVLVRIPRELVTETRREEPAPSASTSESESDTLSDRQLVPPSEPARSAPAPAPAAVAEEAPEATGAPEHARASAPAPEIGESGLPKRRRGQTLAATARPASSDKDSSGTGRSPSARPAGRSGARFGDFRRALQGGGTSETSPSEASPSEASASESAASGASSTPPAPAPSPARSSSLPEDDTE
ncbi:sensor histidine kinase [Streptomyces sp. NPDC048172]|uniref:sensor histidine kinase n=1 Tax=Streptomyces sp. NPDC048172 TaxID=3365505 RepID=UPI0037145DFD